MLHRIRRAWTDLEPLARIERLFRSVCTVAAIVGVIALYALTAAAVEDLLQWPR